MSMLLMGAGKATDAAAGGSSAVWSAATDITRTNSNQTIERTANSQFWAPVLGSVSKANGSFDTVIDAMPGGLGPYIGFATLLDDYPGHDDLGAGTGIAYVATGGVSIANGSIAGAAAYGVGDVIRCTKAGKIVTFYKQTGGSGSFVLQDTIDLEDPAIYGPGFSSPMTAGAYPAFSVGGAASANTKVTSNFASW